MASPELKVKRYFIRRGGSSIRTDQETLSPPTYDDFNRSVTSSIDSSNVRRESSNCSSSASVTTVKNAINRKTNSLHQSKSSEKALTATTQKEVKCVGRFSKWINTVSHIFSQTEPKSDKCKDQKAEQKTSKKCRKNKRKNEPEKRPFDEINIRKLIRLYSKHEYLYNPESYLHGNQEFVEDSYNDLARSFPGYTGSEIYTMTEQLRDLFQREHNAIESMKRNYGEHMRPSIEYYDELSFLEPYLPMYDGNAKNSVNAPPKHLPPARTESGGIGSIGKSLYGGGKSKKNVTIKSSKKNVIQKPSNEQCSCCPPLPPPPQPAASSNNTQCVCGQSLSSPPQVAAPPVSCACFGIQYAPPTYPSPSIPQGHTTISRQNTLERGTSTSMIDCTSSLDQMLATDSSGSYFTNKGSKNGQPRSCSCTEIKPQSRHYDIKQTQRQSLRNSEITCCCSCLSTDVQTMKDFSVGLDHCECEEESTMDTVSGQNNVQVKMLCEMIKMELSDSPDYIYFDAKWRIIEILREVHKRQLVHRKASPATCCCYDNEPEPSIGIPAKIPTNIKVTTMKTSKINRKISCPYCCKG